MENQPDVGKKTRRFRCMKVWLKGEKAGTAETFVDLPGGPDNIRLGSDGHFWIAVLQVTGSRLPHHPNYRPITNRIT